MPNENADHVQDRVAQVGDALINFDIDLNFKRWPVLDPTVQYKKEHLDVRQELTIEPGVDLPDYGGPFKADLRFTDFSREQLVNMLAMNDEYLHVWVGAWLDESELRFGRTERLDLEWLAWRDGMVPKLPAMLQEFLPPAFVDARLETADLGRFVGERPAGDDSIIELTGPFAPDPSMVELSKEELVTIVLGTNEYMLQCNQGIAMQIVVRHGLDTMFEIAWEIWSAKVLPAVKDLKARHMGIDGNDVAAFMKDLQIDVSALPGKAFDLLFEMPEPDVGIMTFNRCPAPVMWEALGREDILEKNCQSTCPASIEETAKLYNPNMKMDILAIPPRVDDTHVCCKWQLSMRTPDDPQYVPIKLSDKPIQD